MKEIFPIPPAIVQNEFEKVRELIKSNVIPSYGRFELVFSHGQGSYLFDVGGRPYLDLGSGIAVCCLGHAHPAITEALVEQSRKLIHVSNLYFTEPQGRLAAELVRRIGRESRSIRRTPNSSSRLLIWRLNGGWAMFTSSAARVKFIVRHRARK